MRRSLLVSFALAFVLCVAAISHASAEPYERYLRGNEDRISLEGGRGVAAFNASGAILGRIRSGKLRITDIRRGRDTEIRVWNAKRVRKLNRRTTVYSGRRMSFSILGGRWKARLKGRGIYASGGVRGTLSLVGTKGTYSIRDGDSQGWPEVRRTFRLG